MSYRTVISVSRPRPPSLASHVFRQRPWRIAAEFARAAFMSAAVIVLALIAEPTCTAAWVWALVPLPSVQQ